jgi:hypothetical protein
VIRGDKDTARVGAELPESKDLELGVEAFKRVDGVQASSQVETFTWGDGCGSGCEIDFCVFDARSAFQSSPHTADTGNTSGHALNREGHGFDGRIDSSFLSLVLASAKPKGKACCQDGGEESLHAFSFGPFWLLFSGFRLGIENLAFLSVEFSAQATIPAGDAVDFSSDLACREKAWLLTAQKGAGANPHTQRGQLRLGLNRRSVSVRLESGDRGLGVEFTVRNNVSDLCIVVDADFFDVGLGEESVPHTADTGNASGHAGDGKADSVLGHARGFECRVIRPGAHVAPTKVAADAQEQHGGQDRLIHASVFVSDRGSCQQFRLKSRGGNRSKRLPPREWRGKASCN